MHACAITHFILMCLDSNFGDVMYVQNVCFTCHTSIFRIKILYYRKTLAVSYIFPLSIDVLAVNNVLFFL